MRTMSGRYKSPTPEEAAKNRREWLKKIRHDPLYNLEKILSSGSKLNKQERSNGRRTNT
jgi:hypothetical protein